jgi:serine protease Do
MKLLPLRSFFVCLLTLGLGSSPVFAQLDKGKNRLPKLFSEINSNAKVSTVRILCDGREAALGTIVSSDGLILTKGSELTGEISVSLHDGSVYDAVQIGYHLPSDLSLIKIDAEGLKAVTFSDSTAYDVGNWVAAVGLKSTPIAIGVISVGVRKLSEQFEEGRIQNSNRGYLGILLSPDDSQDGKGAVVMSVEPKGSARKALQPRDIIIEVAGKQITKADDLFTLLDDSRPGDEIEMKIIRDDKEQTVKVKLGSKTDIDRSDFQNRMGGDLSGRRTGFPAVLQHDTVLRPVDCGGPLVDLEGRILGINIARAGRVETWALPGEVIKPILNDLKQGKYAIIKK